MKVYTFDELAKSKGPWKYKHGKSVYENLKSATRHGLIKPGQKKSLNKWKEHLMGLEKIYPSDEGLRQAPPSSSDEFGPPKYPNRYKKSITDDSYKSFELVKGRGPDKQKRKRRNKGEIYEEKMRTTPKYPFMPSPDNSPKYGFNSGGTWSTRGWKKSLELTPQDEKNIDLIRAMVDKNPDLQKKLEGPIKWVGQEGFDTCVAHLSKKKGITNAKALCGYLKNEARQKGELSPSHMGRLEKKAYKAKKGNKKFSD